MGERAQNWLGLGLALVVACAAQAQQADDRYAYTLDATQIADGTWWVAGEIEHFTMANGGRIANLGFISTSVGTVVIDTGTSLAHGKALRALIEQTVDSPIVRVFNTHQHPDHVLGNGAFADVPIEALAATRDGLRENGGALLDNVYRMLGPWMRGTELQLPTAEATPRTMTLGDHELEILAFDGHTDGDLVIYDRTTGVLFCGDLCFHQRAPTTPDADIDRWLATLRALDALGAKQIVPGHGPIIGAEDSALRLNADYLEWLDGLVRAAVEEGRLMPELMEQPLPARFGPISSPRAEYARSIMHLYPLYEAALFGPAEGGDGGQR
ncbi:MAG: quinoprotein relay system zinc metallohydrolase 1 [Pseudomonadota bacterium]